MMTYWVVGSERGCSSDEYSTGDHVTDTGWHLYGISNDGMIYEYSMGHHMTSTG